MGKEKTRAQVHREMAEKCMQAHKEITDARNEGREPMGVGSAPAKATWYCPQNERWLELDHVPYLDAPFAIKELTLYSKRIPDIAVSSYDIFPSEEGWAMIVRWSGIGEDGKKHGFEEADFYWTDENFNLVKFECYSDSLQCAKIVAYNMDMTMEELMAQNSKGTDTSQYDEILDKA